MNGWKRKSYCLNLKMQVIKEYKFNDAGHGFDALGKKYNLSTSTIRGWVKHQSEIFRTLENTEISTRVARRLLGGGRKKEFGELEDELLKWIKDRNDKGLRVKDKYIRAMAVNIKKKYNSEKYTNFKISSGWLDKFKSRYKLVSRRQTSSRILPKDSDRLARNFIHKIQQIISDKKIEPQNILNMDQVP